MVRAVRGATTVSENSEQEIINQTKFMLQSIIEQNEIKLDDIISVYFSVTTDLDTVFPAKGARELGWTNIPLLDSVSPNVKGSLDKCIRVMLHFNTDKTNNQIKHIYLNDAVKLRPDLIQKI